MINVVYRGGQLIGVDLLLLQLALVLVVVVRSRIKSTHRRTTGSVAAASPLMTSH